MDKKIKRLTSVTNFMRHRENLTIAKVSDQTGLPAMTISRIENRQFTVDISAVLTLANFYHISADAILRNDFRAIFPILSTSKTPKHDLYAKYAKVGALCQMHGISGEDWVYLQECKRLDGTVMANAVSPRYSEDKEAHFDLMTFDAHGEPVIVEVKSTNRGPDDPFFLSASELNLLNECIALGIRYELHRVFHVCDASRIDRRIITGEDLLRDYSFSPESYIVTRKVS